MSIAEARSFGLFIFTTKQYDKEIPTNYVASLKLETGEHGEAHFKFPQLPLAHFSSPGKRANRTVTY